ncbi:3'(2'),5'-bisphosphate nucleotidase CysQ [Thermostichus vulcanus]|uniref:3'(2'),5'-bisphosphate nucleotidase CysQ n=1 Tax=Thermostichus vulcanus str. 'Rupite' TaxID=2813851 RepID=A0ABT0CFA7_THEVL|nr:3'(2'),5'-bisphosphate nucleotidase CysQ [Thermostichus vulcanus]MCJ2544455.1 3'(2'),5'-bisphosphate nucleotidase CysQ [Thermostichus vulcanus str. 'Rupite']
MFNNLEESELADWLPRIACLSEAAGRAILQIFQQEQVQVSAKADQSPLTEADLASHHLILRGLQDLTPEIPVLSEESSGIPYAERQHWRRFWLVDPLDGTKEFIKRNGQFTVNIALVEEGIPVLGVVHAPVLALTYTAAQKLGAYKGETRIRTRTYSEGSLKVVASRSHANPETEQFLSRLQTRYGPLEVSSLGSSLKFCLVAEGSAHLYPRLGPTMEWDTAAAQCVVEQAGGSVTTLGRDPLRYNKPDLHNPPFVVAAQDAAWLWQDLIE